MLNEWLPAEGVLGLDAELPSELPAALADRAWFEAELGHAELGDARRTRRLVDLATALAARPTASIPEACGSPARTKAAYRFFDRGDTVPEGTVPDGIRAAHARATKARLAGQARVLAVQDTT
ncbi:MAG: transposase, partial [Chloroflexi bacterium]|nr:transposase [Chloroflexota bacterium]